MPSRDTDIGIPIMDRLDKSVAIASLEELEKVPKEVNLRALADGRKIVTTAGTSEPLEANENVVKYVIITAETNNTGIVTVGAESVVATVLTRRGIPLNAGDTISLGGVDLNEVYLDVTVSGDGVTYLYLLS